MHPARIIFMGTPEFAVPALTALAQRDDIDLNLVVTQPDRPAGRGKRLLPPPVKRAAEELRVPILQTDSLRYPEVKQRIIDQQPDLIVVAAFGMILGKWILELPTHGCVNLHASLLPSYRGASPISAAIMAGETISGVTLMHMDRGLDTGCMLAKTEISIDDRDTTESLTPRLAEAAASLLDSRLSELLAGTLPCIPQPDGGTETRQLTKEDGRIDWAQPAAAIERQVRAMWSWPRAWTDLADGTRLQIHAAESQPITAHAPGAIRFDGGEVHVGTGQGTLILRRIQLPGGTPVEGNAITQKLARWDGTMFHRHQDHMNERCTV